jgi:hypothetical protein
LHNLPDAVCNVVALFALFGTAKHADGNGRPLVNRETRRLHDLDMDDADVVVKLSAARELDYLLEGRRLSVVAAQRGRVGTNSPAWDIPLILAGGLELRDDREIRLEKRVRPVIKIVCLVHTARGW